jgi:hypothetical protein
MFSVDIGATEKPNYKARAQSPERLDGPKTFGRKATTRKMLEMEFRNGIGLELGQKKGTLQHREIKKAA